ncbi:MAG TPA: transposase [Pirellulaceae bacterium]|nr:transposase [Pirellulaceae bacterium]
MRSENRPDEFVSFDERRAVRIYQRNLPHWRQEGCTYFVTFRLIDSIPANVREHWEWEKSQWLNRHGISYDGEGGTWRAKFSRLPEDERTRFEKHFNRQVQGCLDRSLGRCRLRDCSCITIVRQELFRHDMNNYHLGDFVIMPNHVHALLTPIAPHKLELGMKSIKGASAIACNRVRREAGSFWQPDTYDHIVRTLEQLDAFRQYISANPAMAGIELPAEGVYRASWLDAWFTGGG